MEEMVSTNSLYLEIRGKGCSSAVATSDNWWQSKDRLSSSIIAKGKSNIITTKKTWLNAKEARLFGPKYTLVYPNFACMPLSPSHLLKCSISMHAWYNPNRKCPASLVFIPWSTPILCIHPQAGQEKKRERDAYVLRHMLFPYAELVSYNCSSLLNFLIDFYFGFFPFVLRRRLHSFETNCWHASSSTAAK